MVHTWSTSGVTGIPGYSAYTERAAKAAKFLRRGGYIGLSFGLANTTNEVFNACTTGREQECGEFAFKEYAKFGGTAFGGGLGGAAGASAATVGCLAIGIPTGGLGILACGVVGALGGGYIGGKAGEMSGEMLGEAGIKAKQLVTDFWR